MIDYVNMTRALTVHTRHTTNDRATSSPEGPGQAFSAAGAAGARPPGQHDPAHMQPLHRPDQRTIRHWSRIAYRPKARRRAFQISCCRPRTETADRRSCRRYSERSIGHAPREHCRDAQHPCCPHAPRASGAASPWAADRRGSGALKRGAEASRLMSME